jgi:hypothetical protein
VSGVTIYATPSEIAELKRAILRSCTCDPEHRCSACFMLDTDQRAINGLIWVRRTLLARLLEEEFQLTAEFTTFRHGVSDR